MEARFVGMCGIFTDIAYASVIDVVNLYFINEPIVVEGFGRQIVID